MPDRTAAFSVDLSWKNGSIMISGYFEGERYLDAVNISTPNSHFLSNANVNPKIEDNLPAFAVFRDLPNYSCQLRLFQNFSFWNSFRRFNLFTNIPGLTVTLGPVTGGQ